MKVFFVLINFEIFLKIIVLEIIDSFLNDNKNGLVLVMFIRNNLKIIKWIFTVVCFVNVNMLWKYFLCW